MGKRTTVLYDLISTQPTGSSPVSGGGSYAKRVYFRIIERLDKFNEGNIIAALALRGRALDPVLSGLSDEKGITIHFIEDSGTELLPFIEKLKVDVFYSALPLRYKSLKFPSHVKFIFTIHGLRPLELLGDKYEPLFFYSLRSILKYGITRLFPRTYLRKRHNDFLQLLNAAENYHVITVSEHSHYALLSEYPTLNPSLISTFYSPAEIRDTEPDNSVLEEYELDEEGYFMLICGNRWAKNPYRALKALENLYGKGLLNKKVIITGKGKAKYLKAYEARENFIVADYLSIEKLTSLYKNAYTFIFPTLNEGFGYPPLECMRQGTPVITSPINSLPELLGDAVLWANPYSVQELEGRILRLQNDSELHCELTKKGLNREKKIRDKQIRDLDELVNLILE
ncbi:MAG: glycosyltransferase [Spirochaetales bacterium]|nr:glycosyltransferase [Spirochaetales bacterium]